MSASASSTFIWPGMRPATGWIAKRTSTPFLVSTSYSSRTLCCACATAMPYPGTTTTLFAAERIAAASSGVALRTGFASCPAAADRSREEQEVDEILSFESDRPLRQDFLQLSGGHQTAGERKPAENHFHREHRHHEFRHVGGAQIEFRGADQRHA